MTIKKFTISSIIRKLISRICDPLRSELKKLYETFKQMEDVMLMVFGDHVRIEVTRQGITVEEYEHD